jgi:hypothetical protein
MASSSAPHPIPLAPTLSPSSSPPSLPSSSSTYGHGIIQYHQFPPQHHYHQQQQPLEEEDVQLHDYQMSHSHIGHLGGATQIIGFEINPVLKKDQSNEKRKRTNYSMGGNKAKIEEAVKYLLDLSERARPNVRNVAEKVCSLSLFPRLLILSLIFFVFRWEFLIILLEIISRRLKVSWPLLEELSLIIPWQNIKVGTHLKRLILFLFLRLLNNKKHQPLLIHLM